MLTMTSSQTISNAAQLAVPQVPKAAVPLGLPRPPAAPSGLSRFFNQAMGRQFAQQVVGGQPATLPAVAEAADGASTPAPELGWDTDFDQHYRFIKRIGAGSYGNVFLATEKCSGEQVAVKVVQKDPAAKLSGLTSTTQRSDARHKVLSGLRQEVELLRQMQDCPATVRLRGTYETSSAAFIVMDRLEGGNLEDLLLEHGPLTERQASILLGKVLEVVASCHQKGICHGDVKPHNFILREQHANPVLSLDSGRLEGSWLQAVDFGTAQQVHDSEPLTSKIGTPFYMAPEVFDGSYSLEADMWSVGVLMYQLLTGKLPFCSAQAAQSVTLDGLVAAVRSNDLQLDDAGLAHVSPEGRALLASLLSHDPAARPTAAQVLQHDWFPEMAARAPAPVGLMERARSGALDFQRAASVGLRKQLAVAQVTASQAVTTVISHYEKRMETAGSMSRALSGALNMGRQVSTDMGRALSSELQHVMQLTRMSRGSPAGRGSPEQMARNASMDVDGAGLRFGFI